MIAAGRSAFRVVDLLDLCRLVQGISEHSLPAAGGEEGPQICKVNYAVSVKRNIIGNQGLLDWIPKFLFFDNKDKKSQDGTDTSSELNPLNLRKSRFYYSLPLFGFVSGL